MISGDRMVRLLRNIVGQRDINHVRWCLGEGTLDFVPDLDLEDLATLLRLWSGESDEVTIRTAFTPSAAQALYGIRGSAASFDAADVVIQDGQVVKNRFGDTGTHLLKRIEPDDETRRP